MKSQDAGLIYHLLLLILYIFFENYFFSSKDAQRTWIIKQPYEKIEIRTVLLLNCALTFSSIIFLFKIWAFSIYSFFIIAITVSAYLCI